MPECRGGLLDSAGRPTQSAISADGGTLYTSSLDGTVVKWDLGTQRRFGRPFATQARAPSPSLAVTGPDAPPLAISPDGSRFAVRTAANTVGIFALDTLRRETSLTIRRARITALAWSHAGSELAVGGKRGLVQLWDMSGTPHPVRTFSALKPTSRGLEAVEGVAFSPDDRLIAASDATVSPSGVTNGRVAIWRTTGAVAAALRLGLPTDDVAFSPDGRRLAVSTGNVFAGDGRVLILNSSNGSQVGTIQPLEGDGGTTSLAFAPNGTLATGTNGGVVQLWNPSTGEPIGHPVLAAAAPVASIAFDRSGQQFATAAGPEGGLKLWFTSSLQQDGATLDSEQGTWGNAQFTPDGQLLLAINANGRGSLGPIGLAALENHACAVAGRNLTHEEWSQFISGYKYSQVCP